MQRRLFLLLAAILLLAASALAVMLEEDAYLEAMNLYNGKNFEQANEKFKDFMQSFPDSRYRPNVLLKLAELDNDTDKKIEIYEEIIKKYSDSEHEAEAITSMGKLYYAKAEYEKAEEYLGLVLGKYSNTIWVEPAYYYLMLSLIAREKYGDAANIYADYKKEDKYYVFKNRMNLAYANMLFEQGKFEGAIPLYKDVINGSGSDEKYIYKPAVYYKLIQSYKNVKQPKNVEKYTFELKAKYEDSEEAKKAGKIKEEVFSKKEEGVEVEKDQKIKKEETNIKPDPETKAEKKNEGKASAKGKYYTVQVGAFTNHLNAEKLLKKLKDKEYPVNIRTSGKYYKVQVGRFMTRSDAADMAEILTSKDKISSYLIKQEKN